MATTTGSRLLVATRCLESSLQLAAVTMTVTLHLTSLKSRRSRLVAGFGSYDGVGFIHRERNAGIKPTDADLGAFVAGKVVGLANEGRANLDTMQGPLDTPGQKQPSPNRL